MSRAMLGGHGCGSGDLQLKFNPLPIVEADADDQTYVCEFHGSSGQNEVGVGGGLTGADLVLTQYGDIPGAVDGGRSLTHKSQRFTSTVGLLNRFNLGQNLTMIYQASHLTAGGQMGYPYLSGAGHFFWHNSPMSSLSFGSGDGTAGTSVSVGISGPESLPFNDIFWHILSMNYADGLGFAGIAVGPDLPQSVGDFLGLSFCENAVHRCADITTWSPHYQAVVGTTYNSESARFKIRSLTLSEKPIISRG